MEECYLRFEKEFWGKRGRKIIYSAGTEFIYEVETMSSVVGGEIRRYFVYVKPKVHIGYYEEDEFHEVFMTKDEVRDLKIESIIDQ
jgi:GTPase